MSKRRTAHLSLALIFLAAAHWSIADDSGYWPSRDLILNAELSGSGGGAATGNENANALGRSGASIGIPVFSEKSQASDGHFSSGGLSLKPSFFVDGLSSNYLASPLLVLEPGLLASIYSVNPKGNMLFITAGVSVAEEDGAFSNVVPIWQIYGVGVHRFSSNFNLVYGAGYSPVMGKEVAYPILGFKWKIADEWSLSAILPFIAKLTFKANQDSSYSLFTRPGGSQFHIENGDRFQVASSQGFLRIGQYKVGAETEQKLSPGLSLHIELGALLDQKISFFDETNHELSSSTLPTSGYGAISLAYRFET